MITTTPPYLPRLLRAGTGALNRWLGPLADLLTRIVLFRVFFVSGLTKIDNWEGTLQLFEYEYRVPLLPPDLAAYLGTGVELACPLLLLIGLATRPAVVPLLGLTLVIQFVLGAANPVYDNLDHFLWLALLLHLLARGAGPLSLDHRIARRFG